jgi:hypothetical protein
MENQCLVLSTREPSSYHGLALRRVNVKLPATWCFAANGKLHVVKRKHAALHPVSIITRECECGYSDGLSHGNIREIHVDNEPSRDFFERGA